MFAGGKVWCQIVFLDNQRLCREMCLVKSCITVKADSRCYSTCFCDTAQEISIYISIFFTRTNTTCIIMKWHIQAVPPTRLGRGILVILSTQVCERWIKWVLKCFGGGRVYTSVLFLFIFFIKLLVYITGIRRNSSPNNGNSVIISSPSGSKPVRLFSVEQ